MRTFNKILFLILSTFLFLFFSAFFVQAAEILEKRSTYYSGESAFIRDKTFLVSVEERSVQLTVDNTFLFLREDECETYGSIKVCLEEISLDLEEEKFKARLAFYTKSALLAVSRKIEKKRFFVGEEVEFTLTLTNSGSDKTEEMIYEEQFPEGIRIVDTDGCRQVGNKIVFDKQLDVGDKEEFSYTIIADKEFDLSLKAKLTYFDGFEFQEVYSSPLHLIVDQPVELTKNYKTRSMTVGDKKYVEINITNHFPEKARIYLEIIFPRGLEAQTFSYDPARLYDYPFADDNEITSKEITATPLPRLKKAGFSSPTYLLLNRTLETNSSIIRKMDLLGKRIVNTNIIINGKLESEESDQVLNISDFFKILVFTPDISTYVMIEEQEGKDDQGMVKMEDVDYLESTQNYSLELVVENPHADLILNNLTFTLETPQLLNLSSNFSSLQQKHNITSDLTFFLPQLSPLQQKKIFQLSLQAPLVDKEETFDFNLKADYWTEAGDQREVRWERELKIKPIEDIEIKQDFEKTKLEEGEEFLVKIRVDNKRKFNLKKIRVEDYFSDRFVVNGGVTGRLVDIKAGEEIIVYSYLLQAPEVNQTEEFVFFTSAEYKDDYGRKFSYQKSKTITVKPKTLDLRIKREFPGVDSKNIFQGEIFDVKYTLANKGDDPLNNIRVIFPQTRFHDLIGPKLFKIDMLNPNEEIVFDNIEKIRFKLDGSQKLPPVIVEAEINSITAKEKSSSKTFEVNTSNIHEPAVLLTRIVQSVNSSHLSHNLTVNDTVNLVLEIKNLGLEPVKAEIIYQDLISGEEITRKEFLLPKKVKTIIQSYQFQQPGIYTLNPAQAVYEFNQLVFRTESNSLNLTVKPEILPLNLTIKRIFPEKKQLAIDLTPQNETGINISLGLEKEESLIGSFFQSIWSGLKKIFLWRLRGG